MFNHTTSDRMQLLGRGDLRPPGSCMHCGSGNCDEGYVTLDTFIDLHGETYLCVTCTRQLCELIGALLPEEATALQHDKLEVDLKLAQATEELKVANERVTVFTDAIRAAGGSALVTAFSSMASDAESQVNKSDEPADPAPVSDADAGESEPEESVKDDESSGSNGDATGNRPRRQFSL